MQLRLCLQWAIVIFNLSSLSGGNSNSMAIVSSRIPRNARMVAGPSTLSFDTGTSSISYKNRASLRAVGMRGFPEADSHLDNGLPT